MSDQATALRGLMAGRFAPGRAMKDKNKMAYDRQGARAWHDPAVA